jgi:hypothetical protein
MKTDTHDPYNLFLDDLRYPKDAYLSDTHESLIDSTGIPNNQWQIVRTYDSFVRYIEKNGLPSIISFDHDLHQEHIEYYFKVTALTKGVIEYGNLKNKTGKSCAEYLVKKWIEAGKPPIKTYVHSANSYGAANIQKVLDEIK